MRRFPSPMMFAIALVLLAPMLAEATSYPEQATEDVFSSSFVISPTGWMTPQNSPRFSLGTRGLPAVELPLLPRLTLHVQTLVTYYTRVGILVDIVHSRRAGISARLGAASSPYAFSVLEIDAGLHGWILLNQNNVRSTLLGAGIGVMTGGDLDYNVAQPFTTDQSGMTYNLAFLQRLTRHYSLVVEWTGGFNLGRDSVYLLLFGGRYSSKRFGIQFGLFRPFVPSEPRAFENVAAIPYVSFGWQFSD